MSDLTESEIIALYRDEPAKALTHCARGWIAWAVGKSEAEKDAASKRMFPFLRAEIKRLKREEVA